MRAFIPVLILGVILSAAPAGAAGKPVTPLTRLDAATNKMMEGMSENHLRQFAAIRNSHGIIRAVSDVRENLDKAVKNCAVKHPDLSGLVTGRFSAWSGTIDPVIEEARQRLNMMVKLQDFAKPQEARGYLKQLDDAVAYKTRGAKPVPIDSRRECKKLIETLDDTEKELKKTLVENLGLRKPLIQEPE